MVSEWQEVRLGDAINLKRGYDLPSQARAAGDVPIVSSSGVSGFHNEAKVRAPGVVTGRYGTIGQVHFIENDFWPLNTALYVQDFKGNLPRFVGYLLQTIDYHQFSDKAAVPGVNRNDLHEAKISLPPLEEQRAIAETLGTLDDRIDNLRQTNATLEAIAAALFKSWFVDFDGIAPEDMQKSELGLIPKGWRVEEIGNLVQCVGGATPSTKDETFWDGGIHHWATPKDLSGLQSPILTTTERLITDAGIARISSGLLPAGTLLMSSRAPIGYLAISAVPVAINQGFIAMPPGGSLSPNWMLFWAKTNMEAIKQKANGSTFMEISKAAFRPIKVIAPPKEALATFDEVVAPMVERIKNNEQHIATIATLRDTLPPRLISGQLRVAQ
jgi:type I restriction enzyme S subunit